MQGCRDQEEEGWQRCLVEDDMAGGGDLGDGTVRQPAALTPVCGGKTLPVSAAVTQSRSHAPSGAEDLSPPPVGGALKRGSLQGGSEGGPPSRAPSSSSSSHGLYSRPPPEGERMGGAPWRRLTRTQSTADLSKDELRTRLQEVTEESELLRCELEVTRRYLEGKYEALKILQGQAILDKATGHTKNLLQKSEERAKALEKEVNGLQWEVTFNQVQMKNFEQSWQQKYDRVCTENRALSDSLGGRAREVQELRAENAALNQQCLELLSMLSVREQKAFQGSTAPPCGRGREVTVLELGVLGACQCPGAREPCPCARTAASSRKHVLQLRHELDSQRRRNEEALMMADAFRIAFEQQLRKRNDHFLLRAADAADRIKSRPSRKSEGAHRIVVQKLRELLPSSTQLQLSDEPADILHKLLDLLNDKEEALAHQRKVSLMLARSTEELERRLQPHEHAHHRKPQSHLHCKPSVSEPKDCVHCQPLPSAPESHLHCQPPPSASESHLHCQPPPSAPESHLHCQPPPSASESHLHCQPPPSAPESHLHCQPQPSASESHLHCQPPPIAPESHLHCQPSPSASESHLHCQPPPSASESHLHCQPPPSASESHLHCQPPPSAPESHLQEHLQLPETSCDSRYQRSESKQHLHQSVTPSVPKPLQHQSVTPSVPKPLQHQSVPPSVPMPLQPRRNCACGNTRDAPH